MTDTEIFLAFQKSNCDSLLQFLRWYGKPDGYQLDITEALQIIIDNQKED